jgi:putative methyltransferase (TIGR04325 family)
MARLNRALKHRLKGVIELLPAGRDLYLTLARSRIGITYRGVFETAGEAKSHVPKGRAYEYDIINRNKASNEERESANIDQWFHYGDYPLLFWVSQLIGARQSVLELGGSVGHFFYAIQKYIKLQTDLRWTIAELPEAVALGSKLAADRDENRLQFIASSAIADAEPASIFLTAGTLQYMNLTLANVVASLQQRPLHVLVHMLPTHNNRSFWTLQNLGVCELPYRVCSKPELLSSMSHLGYELVDTWDNPRSVDIPWHLDLSIDGYLGYYFRHT